MPRTAEFDAEYTVQGIPMSRLAEEYGTPLFVYDGDVLEATYRELRGLLSPRIDLLYSLKANPNVSVCAVLRRMGAGAEVSSLAELRVAQQAGVQPQDTIYLGPGKTDEELRAATDARLYGIVCESVDELRDLETIAADRGVERVDVMLRVNPEFHAKGSGLAMGGKPRQFGIDAAVLSTQRGLIDGLRRVRVKGIHAYMGTRFLDHTDVVRNTTEILALAGRLADDLGFPMETVDVGGGLGVAYFEHEKDLDVTALAEGVNEQVTRFLSRHQGTRVLIELGRYLTATCGVYVTRALYVKRSMGTDFVVTDGGTNHHMAAVGTGSFVKRNFPIRSLTRHAEPAVHTYTVTGPLCTPNDVLGKKVALPRVAPGDLIGVERSGAYGPSASPGLFLSHGFPAEVLVHRGTPHLVRVRDTVADLLAKQRLAPL